MILHNFFYFPITYPDVASIIRVFSAYRKYKHVPLFLPWRNVFYPYFFGRFLGRGPGWVIKSAWVLKSSFSFAWSNKKNISGGNGR